MEYYKLKVDKVNRETKDSVSIAFQLDMDHPLRNYQPGQYLSLKYKLLDETFIRCYSYSSLPKDEVISFTVKKTKHGFISKELVDKIKVGDELEVSLAQGKFKIPASNGQKRSHYFFAGGSGITPIMSMIRHILEEEANSVIYLLYSNKNEDDIIFYSLLKEIENIYQGQIKIFFTLTNKNNNLFQKIFSSKKDTWSGWKGRVNHELIDKFFQECGDRNKQAEYYICGPEKLITKIEKVLLEKNIDVKNIHKEYFSLSSEKKSPKSVDINQLPASSLIFTLNGKKNSIQLQAGEKILDALIREGFDPPYSCSSGACSSCVAKKISGEIIMDSSLALDENEIKSGYILTCQSRCTTEQVEIVY